MQKSYTARSRSWIVLFAVAVSLPTLSLSAGVCASELNNGELNNGELKLGETNDGEWGNLTGKIVVVGNAPKPEKLVITKDQAYCGRHDLEDESLVVSDDGGLKNVFVYLYQSRRDRQEPPIHESYSASESKEVILDNIKCRFEPHTLLMRTTQPFVAKNSDEVGHNANVESRNNFVNPQIPANSSQTLELGTPEREPVKVSCGSHGWMSAYVLIRDEPYAAVTDATGSFEIKNLPAGEWTFQFWHERTKALSDLTKDGEAFVGRRGEVTITIRDGETTDLGTLRIDVSALAD